MNFKQVVENILSISKDLPMVNEVGYGDIYEHLNSGNHKYPCVFLTVDNVTTDSNFGQDTINGTLFYVDRLLDNCKNKIDIQSCAITTLEDLNIKFQEAYGIMAEANVTLFTEQFSDMCAGGYMPIQITYLQDSLC